MASLPIFNSTEMAEKILTSDEARQMYNMVSPIYGESYVALSIFQALGKALDKVKGYIEDVPNQLNPEKATWLLPWWEERYGITPGADWTLERRREAVISKRQFYAPITPEKLSSLLTALVGVLVDVIENTGQNQFSVYIRQNVTEDKYASGIQFVDAAKPAHLIYDIAIAEEHVVPVSNYVAVGTAVKENYYVEVS